jgi:hypothetical protein
MKSFLVLITLLITNFVYSQIGVVTVRKKDKVVPLSMWFVSTEKERRNQMYYMSEYEGEINEVLNNVLSDLYIEFEFPIGRDGSENPYWGVELENDYYITVYLDYPTKEFKYYMVTIVTQEQ